MAAEPAPDFNPWQKIEADVVRAFDSSVNKTAHALVAVLERAAHYAKVDSSASEILVDRRAFFFGLLSYGLQDKPSISYGNTATWVASWTAVRAGPELLTTLRDGVTGTDELLGSHQSGLPVVASEFMHSVAALAVDFARRTVGRDLADLRHFFAAFIENSSTAISGIASVGWIPTTTDIKDLQLELFGRIGKSPEPNEEMEAWRRILHIEELPHASSSSVSVGEEIQRPPGRIPTPTATSAPTVWMDDFLARHGIQNVTPLARLILEKAASLNPPQPEQGEISTTRLFIAMLDAHRSIEAGGEVEADGVGIVALNRVLMPEGPFAQVRKVEIDYLREARRTSSALNRVDATKNIGAILTLALSELGPIFGPANSLSTNALIAALLRNDDTKLKGRLAEQNIFLPELRTALLTEIQNLDSPDVELWSKALGIVVSRITFARMGNDNPDRANLDDKLGVKDEAHAFARVASARQVDPPLAFGIFGDWGSGKSFFMRLMQEHVDRLANKKADEAKTDLFHQNIVQIRFNAWHYVETNLWASLVDYIFFELDRWLQKKLGSSEHDSLFDKLATARELTLESAERLARQRKEQMAAAESLASSERALTAAREVVGGTPRLFWKVVQTNFEQAITKKDFAAAATTLGLEQLVGDTKLLKEQLDSLEHAGQRAKFVTNSVRYKLLAMPSLVFVLAAIIFVPPILIWLRDTLVAAASSSPDLQAFLKNFDGIVLGVAGVLASAATVLGVITGKVRSAVSTLEGFRDELDRVIEEQVKAPSEEVKRAEENLAKLTANVAEARALLSNSSDRLAEAARDYASGTGRGRLLRFVRERATDGQYAKHLGLIAAVRKDFTELSAMMSKVDPGVKAASIRQVKSYQSRVQALLDAVADDDLLTEDDRKKLLQSAHVATTIPEQTFERIILYIDDLDRCPPQKVVDVLQAVHLLLTFPLFVVVVAVDVRWVSRSLETHYATLLSKDESSIPGATARDYLEKIFQVPYWVRAMTPEGSRDLLMALAAPPLDSASDVKATDGPKSDVTNPAGETSGPDANGAAAQGGETSEETGANPTAAGNRTDNRIDQDVLSGTEQASEMKVNFEVASEIPLASSMPVAARALELTPGEQAFMKSLAPWVGDTPRRALRFLNVYRVIKASLGATELQKLEQDGGYRGLMTQLAIVTGAPNLRKSWVDVLSASKIDATLQTIEPQLTTQMSFVSSPESRLLSGAIETFWSARQTLGSDDSAQTESQNAVDQAHKNAIADLRHYGDIAKRYSFGI